MANLQKMSVELSLKTGLNYPYIREADSYVISFFQSELLFPIYQIAPHDMPCVPGSRNSVAKKTHKQTKTLSLLLLLYRADRLLLEPMKSTQDEIPNHQPGFKTLQDILK